MEKQPISIRNFICYESANLICGFRILASVFLAFAPMRALWLAVLCSLAFISDTLDGWCYRRYVDQPYQHWFNQLPLTLDPIADFVFVIGCVLHLMMPIDYVAGCKIAFILATSAMILNLLGGFTKNGTVLHKVIMTTLTYYWFVAMLISVCLIWLVNARGCWIQGIAATLIIFYAIFFKVRVPSRTIRG